MNKRVLGVLLAGTLSASILAGSVINAGAVKTDHSKYVPSEGVETYKYYIAMPGAWINESTHDNNDAAGLYWWSAPDEPGLKFANGWPGYECDKEDGQVDTKGEPIVNLYSIQCPVQAGTLCWNNYLDGGMDVSAPVFKDAQQGANFPCEYLEPGYDDNYPEETFWTYFYEKAAEQYGFEKEGAYENADLYEAMLADPDTLDFSDLGDYGKNFFIETKNESGLVFNYQNMIYVVDLNPEHITLDTTMVPEGKPQYAGDMYFYYGNGEYGTWPTKELAIEKGGVKVLEDGSYKSFDDKDPDEFGNIYDAKGALAIGNFTGNYWTAAAPDIPAPSVNPTATTAPATVPAPNGNDAKSSTSDSTKDSANNNNTNTNNGTNGAVQTGAASFAVIVLAAALGAVVVGYFRRRETE